MIQEVRNETKPQMNLDDFVSEFCINCEERNPNTTPEHCEYRSQCRTVYVQRINEVYYDDRKIQ